MNVTVRYFAAYREAAGCEKESLNTGAFSPGELFAECVNRHPGLRDYTASMVAINDQMACWDSVLEEGDEILFFPPVAGG